MKQQSLSIENAASIVTAKMGLQIGHTHHLPTTDPAKGMHLLSDSCIGIQADRMCDLVFQVIFAGACCL